MLCDGSLLPIRQNAALYSLLGLRYGGDGVNTFALPDLRGRTTLGFGAGPGLTQRNLGDKGGTETVTLSLATLPSHSHAATFAPSSSGGAPTATLQASAAQATTSNPSGNYLANGYTSGAATGSDAISVNSFIEPGNAGPLSNVAGLNVVGAGGSGTVTVGTSGQGHPISTMPPYTTVNFIIATTGLFPMRP
jgi:microcystin-dependent protein